MLCNYEWFRFVPICDLFFFRGGREGDEEEVWDTGWQGGEVVEQVYD